LPLIIEGVTEKVLQRNKFITSFFVSKNKKVISEHHRKLKTRSNL